MDHPSAVLIRQHSSKLSRGDIDGALEDYAEDFLFHYPGRNPLSGEVRGKEEFRAFLRRVFELTQGTFRVEVHDILANDDHAVLLGRIRAEHGSKRLEWDAIDIYHIRAGKIQEHWVHEADQAEVDAFWS